MMYIIELKFIKFQMVNCLLILHIHHNCPCNLNDYNIIYNLYCEKCACYFLELKVFIKIRN